MAEKTSKNKRTLVSWACMCSQTETNRVHHSLFINVDPSFDRLNVLNPGGKPTFCVATYVSETGLFPDALVCTAVVLQTNHGSTSLLQPLRHHFSNGGKIHMEGTPKPFGTFYA